MRFRGPKNWLLLFAFFLFTLSSVVLVLWPVSPAVQREISRDSGAFLYIGWRWSQGELPYRDVWDHKPPGVYWIDRLGLMLTPDSLWGVWALEVVFLMVAASSGFLVLYTAFGAPTALVTTYLWLYTLLFLLDGGNLTQEYALPLQFLSLALWLKTAQRGRVSNLDAWVLGLLAGLAFMVRQNTVGLAGVVLASWLLAPEPTRRERGQQVLAFLFGGGLVVLMVAGYFAAHGALKDFWDQAFAFNFLYAQERTLKRRILEFLDGLGNFPGTGLLLLGILGYATALWYQRASLPHAPRWLPRLATLALVAGPIELFMVALPGRGRVPYFTSLLPLLSLLSGFALSRGLSPVYWRNRRVLSLVTAGILLSLSSLHFRPYRAILRAARSVHFAEQTLAYIAAHTTPEDTLLVFGAEPEINFLARRRSPTRFVYQYALYRRRYAGETMLLEFYQNIWNARPKILIVAMPEAEGEIPDGFGPNRSPKATALVERLRAMYQRVGNMDGWTVYVRKEAP